MKKLCILGVTGSIGTQVLEVVRNHKDLFKVVAISFGKNIGLAKSIIEEFHVEFVSSLYEENAKEIKECFPNVLIKAKEDSLIECARYGKDTIVINSLVGISGLLPTIEAIKMGKRILLANKETLVTAGEIINKLIKETGSEIFPIDSEHSAIFQCLMAGKKENVRRIIITASGGSLRDVSKDNLKNVTIEDVLKHPNWSMGKKVTIDSATMVNKGLEVIEAHFLFDIPYDKIETLIHPQSIIHSMVEYNDGNVMALLASPNMMIPIQYALTYPERVENSNFQYLSFSKLKNIEFKEMDFDRFPCLKMAYDAGIAGGVMPTIFNAANEKAVELFINGKIKFIDIEYIIKDALASYQNITSPLLEDILKVDKEVKEKISRKYEVN